ncbi:hypothetical protein HY798_01145 [Candidatus Falkowbacteria bacterium]|nr:hypothetical protein [Candidatus Falkowbacteria bacterium]
MGRKDARQGNDYFDFDGTIAHPWWQGFSAAHKALLAKICKKRLAPKNSLKEIFFQR